MKLMIILKKVVFYLNITFFITLLLRNIKNIIFAINLCIYIYFVSKYVYYIFIIRYYIKTKSVIDS